MKLKSRHYRHHHTKTVNGKKQLYLLAAAIIILAIGVGTLSYFKGGVHVSNTASRLPDHFSDNYGNTFDNKPFANSGTVQQLVLTGGQVLQYFDNASDTGILYKINQSPVQIQQNYIKQFAASGWAIPLNSPVALNTFYFSNSSTKQNAKISVIALPKGAGSSVVVGLQK